MQERSGGNSDDDDVISNNIIGVCVVVSGGHPDSDEKRPHEPEIFPDMVFFGGYIADLCNIPAGHPFFYEADRRVFGGKCRFFHRCVFPDFDCFIFDIHCIRTVRTNPDIGTDAGDFRKTRTGFGEESGAAGA